MNASEYTKNISFQIPKQENPDANLSQTGNNYNLYMRRSGKNRLTETF
jgi:hypothetical protein